MSQRLPVAPTTGQQSIKMCTVLYLMMSFTRVVRIRLKHDRGFAGWVNAANHASRYVYNRAVSTYLFGGGYLDRVVVGLPATPDSFRLPDREGGVVGGNLAAVTWHCHAHAFGPSGMAMKYGMFKELTGWRAGTGWLRDCPLAYERGAILDASVACRGVVEDCSDCPPYRPKDGRIILSSADPPIRKGDHLVHVPGYGLVETATRVDPAWDMRSFRMVDATDRITRRTIPSDRKFELHAAIREQAEPRRPTGVVRGVDVGGCHLAVTADTAGRTATHDVRHKDILKEVHALKGVRDRHPMGGRRWSRLNKRIRRLQAKANRVADNSVNQAVAGVVRGADRVVAERISIRGMTAHGGNRKRGMNRSMRESGVGKFLRKVGEKCEQAGVALDGVPAPYTSQTCHVCGHVDSKSRVSRGRFVCVKCHREFHADVNAAWNVLCWAAGKVVLRRLESWWGDKPKPRGLPTIMVVGASRKKMRSVEAVHLSI